MSGVRASSPWLAQAVPADHRQHVSGPPGGDQADAGVRYRPVRPPDPRQHHVQSVLPLSRVSGMCSGAAGRATPG